MRKMKLNKKKIAAGVLALSFVLSLTGPVYPANGDHSIAVVEAAKKDKKKPKITLTGKKKLTAEVGKNVTIPKTTYSDNVTKKKKLKVAVTVKKGKKNYSDIAKKIKKATLNGKTVKVKFPEEGTYKIATTITDEAKNKATATRTVTVTSSAKDTKNNDSKQKEVTDYSKYDIKQITVDGNSYNYLKNDSLSEILVQAKTDSEFITLNIENDYEGIKLDLDDGEFAAETYLKYFGKITATDKNGNDISDRVVICDYSEETLRNTLSGIGIIYVEDLEGNKLKKYFDIMTYKFDDNYNEDYFIGNGYKMINNKPKVYAKPRTLNISKNNINKYSLKYKI